MFSAKIEKYTHFDQSSSVFGKIIITNLTENGAFYPILTYINTILKVEIQWKGGLFSTARQKLKVKQP